MPDTLNKQSLVNLLIDSPLREPIKINLIDIVNNTAEVDLPKIYSTITKELEIFQKATERRMKLAEETIAKLGGAAPSAPEMPPAPPSPAAPSPEPIMPPAMSTAGEPGLSVPPLDLPPMPASTSSSLGGPAQQTAQPEPTTPSAPVAASPMPAPQPLGSTPMNASTDEDALAEIQKELDSLKSTTAAEVTAAAAPAPAPAKQ